MNYLRDRDSDSTSNQTIRWELRMNAYVRASLSRCSLGRVLKQSKQQPSAHSKEHTPKWCASVRVYARCHGKMNNCCSLPMHIVYAYMCELQINHIKCRREEQKRINRFTLASYACNRDRLPSTDYTNATAYACDFIGIRPKWINM